jgi:hypothetical protein
MQTRPHCLIEVQWPELSEAARPPEPPAAEFERRLALTRAAMGRRGWTHLVVYGDREHFANLAWLTQVDPRFEEMLLVLGPASYPLIVGTNAKATSFSRCIGGWPAGRAVPGGSLLNQLRDGNRTLREILAARIGAPAAGCAGCASLTDDPAGRSRRAQLSPTHWRSGPGATA